MPDDDEVLRLRLPQALKEKFRLYCAVKGITMSDAVREWIETTLREVDLEKLLQERFKDQ